MSFLWLKIMFAGLWPLINAYFWPLLVVAAILAVEFFTAEIEAALPFLAGGLERIRKDLMWVAAVIVLCITWGVHIEIITNKRCLAKAVVIDNAVSKVVKDANGNTALQKPDKFETNQ